MSHHWSDNVHTTAFTPRDFQVELLAAAREKNIIVCLGHNSSKEFIALKLIQELGCALRRVVDRKITLLITNAAADDSVCNLIANLTDFKLININRREDIDWTTVCSDYHIIVLSAALCRTALAAGHIELNSINLCVIDECHQNCGNQDLSEIFERYYRNARSPPKILGLAGPLHSAGCPPGRLGAELELLERSLDCKAETASDVVTVLRYCPNPVELIVESALPTQDRIASFLRDLILNKKAFLKDHRFDPSEIYSDEFADELNAIPDPKKEPLEYLDEFLSVLDELGPWCADRAAVNLLIKIEKKKIQTPYERHFLLLCLISTTFVQIRSYCDFFFQAIVSTKERVEQFSTPKVLRILEILRLFKPDPLLKRNNSANQLAKDENKHLAEIDLLDFKRVCKSIESTSVSIESPAVEKDFRDLTHTLGQLVLGEEPKPQVTYRHPEPRINRFRRRLPGTGRHGGRAHYHSQNDPDALCGIIFCNTNFTAKILYNLLCEVSKCDPDLEFLSPQYTVDKVADPMTAAKEAEAEHRAQEDVLKRFRMHDSNLLIGTSVLEEGIDLPRCNLVVRWDPPNTYRSYVQCKGRAKASNAYHIIMVAPIVRTINERVTNSLACANHRLVCKPGILCQDSDESDDSDDSDDESIYEKVLPAKEISSADSSPLKTLQLDGLLDVNELLNFKTKTVEKVKSITVKTERCVIKETVSAPQLTRIVKDMAQCQQEIVEKLAEYMEIEKMLLRKCDNIEPDKAELTHADRFVNCIAPYRPLPDDANGAFVNLSTAVALINKYCAKLPSDTFTKLTPLWRFSKTMRGTASMYLCTLRLPINSPLKNDIVGLPMPTRILARRIAALIASRLLHKSGELDNSLQPIGKEGFRAAEPDWENFELDESDEAIVNANAEPRPGTTKRRQYYYKRIASSFSDCRPTVGTRAYLYHIDMVLKCPIPEEQNTRGRRIYPPEEAVQGFGILTLKKIPKLSAFPIFTRSGEVEVSLQLAATDIQLDDMQIGRISTFINYTFTNVLRLQKYLMLFDAEATENCFFIVPTVKQSIDRIAVDWNFLETIALNADMTPKSIPDELRRTQEFDAHRFRDAVVMPWYRNQDQPQYFYVAEICTHLSPDSSFPGENYRTFKEYYFRKYGIDIQNEKQPLLDVDHTSARLNFLTPRYVNRKGVALPTSSEETKRAKRENLEQKQILVPELCTVHPFPASLWRAAVCLPCILYRFNALLLADEIRKQVANELGLGTLIIENTDFKWPVLDFGWSLTEVLRKSREAKQANRSVDVPDAPVVEQIKIAPPVDVVPEKVEVKITNGDHSEEINDGKTVNDILDEADQKLKSESLLEIGTWSNEMANDIEYDDVELDSEEWIGILPANINICSRAKTKIRYGSPSSWDVTTQVNPIDNYFSDSDASYQSDEDEELDIAAKETENFPLHIEFKTDYIAEAIETAEELQRREKKLAIINGINANEKKYQSEKNMGMGFDSFGKANGNRLKEHEEQFEKSTAALQEIILSSGMLIESDKAVSFNPRKQTEELVKLEPTVPLLVEMIPFLGEEVIRYIAGSTCCLTLDKLYEINCNYASQNGKECFRIEGSGDVFDNFNDNLTMVKNEKDWKDVVLDFTILQNDHEKIIDWRREQQDVPPHAAVVDLVKFSFDYQPELNGHPGPSPSIILQALTMSNANDGINLERLETIGDSFLKYAITTYLYCTYENVHEGKLSHLRSKQVSNLNLYRLGRKKVLGECMISTKFEPHDNWLPPCYYVPRELEKALIEAKIPACHWNLVDIPNLKDRSKDEICSLVRERAENLGLIDDNNVADKPMPVVTSNSNSNSNQGNTFDSFPCFIPYNLVTQHSIPDKSVADCVEALIGAYLIECGPRGALLFMAWLGIRVLPVVRQPFYSDAARIPGSTLALDVDDSTVANGAEQMVYGAWAPPKSPLLHHAPLPHESLAILLDGFAAFEVAIGYQFNDRSYLLQAMTHASYSPNRLTDCYQRLEFLGDAVLDYLITRHLYEDPRQHSPGALTDLRSALVNNTIFASLAVRHGFHKYFRHLSPALNDVIDRFVRIQNENGHSISEEYYLISEDECGEAEDVEVPKALGDVFESVAGAIFLDSNMSLDTVWLVYSNMMRPEIELFSSSVPKSPIRELLELEPETAKFSKPERLADGRRVRVTVEVFGKGAFRGIGRNYRIAKCTAAKCALRQLKNRVPHRKSNIPNTAKQ